MSATITIDMREFNAALSEYVKWSKRSLPDIINRKAAAVAYAAYKNTPRADPSVIQQELSLRVAGQRTNKKTGKTRNVYALDDRRAVAGIMYARDKAVGKTPRSYAEYKASALKYAANRVTAVGTLAAGWIGAVRKLIKAANTQIGGMQWKKHKGFGNAVPAVNGWSPVATFSYNLLERKPGGAQIDPRCVDALQAAFNEEAKSTMEEVARRMQEQANRINAR